MHARVGVYPGGVVVGTWVVGTGCGVVQVPGTGYWVLYWPGLYPVLAWPLLLYWPGLSNTGLGLSNTGLASLIQGLASLYHGLASLYHGLASLYGFSSPNGFYWISESSNCGF